MRSFLLATMALTLFAGDALPATVYRIGLPLTNSEKDSLKNIGHDFKEVPWSLHQVQEFIDVDSMRLGSLQPKFFQEDEDIAATLLSRDGFVGVVYYVFWDKSAGNVLIDQDPASSFTWEAIDPESFDASNLPDWATPRFAVLLDLGGRFLIREVRFRPVADRPDHFLEHFKIGVSDRGFDTFRIPEFPTLVEVKENTQADVRVVFDKAVITEAIQLKILRSTPKEVGLAAVEVYGGGYVTWAAYESDVIDLDDIGSWGDIHWSGRRDRSARVAIRTRLGSDAQPEIFWETRPEQQDSVRFLQGGGDLNFTEYKREYGKLSDFLKPIAEEDRVGHDEDNWSFWSSPYVFENPGVSIVSAGPRQFIQIKAEFSSTIEDGGKIDYIQFKVSVPPSVRRLVGEVGPVETKIGEETRFTYYISSTIRSGDNGFDGVEISTPSGVVSVDSLRMGGIDYENFSWRIHGDGLGFDVILPRRLEPTDSGILLEIVFTAPVLREIGTLFEGWAFDTFKPYEVRQRIVPGNATEEVDSNRMSVTASFSASLVFSPRASPNPFTPNSDGINDVVNISYKLLRVISAVPVSLGIFDLSGNLVKQVYAGDESFGEFSHVWDGTDATNRFVPQGLYLYRIAADFGIEREIYSGIISLTY